MDTISLDAARRIAARAQLLDDGGPRSLLDVVERLTFLQLDPIAVVAPNADLVLWSRLGNSYSPTDLVTALERDRSMFEFRGQDRHNEPVFVMNRPTSQLGLVLGQMLALRDGPGQVNDWLAANAEFRQRVLDRLRDDGPQLSRDIADTAAVPWKSSGWTGERNVNQMLEFLWSRGHVAVARREGKQRVWALADQVYPADVTPIPVDEATPERDRLRLRALGIARPRLVGDAGIPVSIDGTRGVWRLDPEATAESFEGRTVLLSPFDRLVHDRKRAEELFGFEFTLELYKRKHERRYGYYVLPVLHGDRLIGKADAAADRDRGLLTVPTLHLDVDWTSSMRRAVDDQLAALAAWIGLGGVTVERVVGT